MGRKTVLIAFVVGMLATEGGGAWAAECGCGAREAPSCSQCGSCRHCCRCSCGRQRESRPLASRFDSAVPRAAIVDSMPVFQITPGVVSVPMMMASFGTQRSYEPPRAEKTCSASKDRLDELEFQVNGLDQRMRVMQRTMEIQLRLLEEMKAEGKFPQRYVTPDQTRQ